MTPQQTTAADGESRTAYLFAAGRWRAVSLAPRVALLPPAPSGADWVYATSVEIGVHHVELPGTEPEPVITGLAARGYYIWQVSTDEAAAL